MAKKLAEDMVSPPPARKSQRLDACYVTPNAVCKNWRTGSCVGNPDNYDPQTYCWDPNIKNGPEWRHGGRDGAHELQCKKAARKATLCCECFEQGGYADTIPQQKKKSNLEDGEVRSGMGSVEIEQSAALETMAGNASSSHITAVVPEKVKSSPNVTSTSEATPLNQMREVISNSEQSSQAPTSAASRLRSQKASLGSQNDAYLDYRRSNSIKRKREVASSSKQASKKPAIAASRTIRSILVKPDAPRVSPSRTLTFAKDTKTAPELTTRAVAPNKNFSSGGHPMPRTLQAIVTKANKDSIADVDKIIKRITSIRDAMTAEIAAGIIQGKQADSILSSANTWLQVAKQRRETIEKQIAGVTIIPSIYIRLALTWHTVVGIDQAIAHYDNIVRVLGTGLQDRVKNTAFQNSYNKKQVMAHIKVAYDCMLMLEQRGVELEQRADGQEQ